jgi:hypothetical protein
MRKLGKPSGGNGHVGVGSQPPMCLPVCAPQRRAVPRRSGATKPRRPSRVVQLLEEILASLQSQNTGNATDDGDAYILSLVRLRRLKILRDLYYPTWSADWG